MKRDMDLIRQILMRMEESEHGNAPDILDIENYSEEQIGYHCFILADAGLISAADNTAACDPSPCAIPISLTWSGHEFIANAKNEKMWGQTKDAVRKIGDVSFSVWASVLTEVVKNNIGLSS